MDADRSAGAGREQRIPDAGHRQWCPGVECHEHALRDRDGDKQQRAGVCSAEPDKLHGRGTGDIEPDQQRNRCGCSGEHADLHVAGITGWSDDQHEHGRDHMAADGSARAECKQCVHDSGDE